MSELRQDPTTNDWIIFAREREKRPEEFRETRVGKSLPEFSEDCPFCPGNEHRTPEAAAVYGEGDGWEIRVIPNRFPALTPDGDTSRKEQKLFRRFHGYGRHEVVIETPRHNGPIPFMDVGHVKRLIGVYRDRYHALKKDPDIKTIIIFKNHGEEAGTSVVHPHTQIVASPIVPPFIRRRFEIATEYYDNKGRCLYCDIRLDEGESGERIVRETDLFLVLHPFASHYPFETWIVPKKHKSSFGNISDEEAGELALVLKEALFKLRSALDDPDYNFIIHTSPVDDERKSYYLWHVQIIPRLTETAGFELGSGIYINTAMPESTAEFMRKFRAEGG